MSAHYCITIFIACLLLALTSAQSLQNATWVEGSELPDQPGNYNNSLAAIGSRADAASWVDGQQFWIFGGFGYGSAVPTTPVLEPGLLNDLWKYSNSWWYVNGSTTTEPPSEAPPVVAVYPGGRRNAAHWKANGQLWIFGGVGLDSGFEEGILNDLWSYNITSGTWTFKGGSQFADVPPQYNSTLPVPPNTEPIPANPGSRECAFTWVTHGANGAATLWLYGGLTAEEAGYHNDLWTYDLTTNAWTWVAGTNQTEGGEVEIEVEGARKRALRTSPSPRSCGASWVGSDGGLYLFGGHYVNETFVETTTLLNDIWKFNTSTYQWTLVQQATPAGVYNNTANDRPAPRYGPAFTHDSRGNLYIFGGKTPLIEEGIDTRNDLWVYYTAKNEWKWLLGSATPNAPGVYNVTTRKGVPGARAGASLWIDAQERLWLFGGSNTAEEDFGFRNDLWILIEDVDPTPPTTSTTGDATSGGLTTGAATGDVTSGSITSGSVTTGAITSGAITTGSVTSGSVATSGSVTSGSVATSGSVTSGSITTGVTTSNATGNATTGDSLTTGQQTSSTGTTTSQSLTSGSSTAAITTGLSSTTGGNYTSSTTGGNHTITTTGGSPHSGVSTGVIVGSVFGGGITISAGVVGVLLWRGNLRFRNIFRRDENEEANELLPLNRKRVINSV